MKCRWHQSYPTRSDFISLLIGCNARMFIEVTEPVYADGKPHSFRDWDEQRGFLCPKYGKARRRRFDV
jgi:hypothetical protein